MKTISDVKLNYLIGRLKQQMLVPLQAHLSDRNNPHALTLEQLKTADDRPFLDAVYPVGAIYMTASETDPAALFGGGWEQIRGRFLLAAGEGRSLGATGGEAVHTLTVGELPSHSHAFHSITPTYRVQAGSSDYWPYLVSLNETHAVHQDIRYEQAVVAEGGGLPHNNLPPYLAVNVWKRVQ